MRNEEREPCVCDYLNLLVREKDKIKLMSGLVKVTGTLCVGVAKESAVCLLL